MKEWVMKKMTIVLSILFFSLLVWFPSAQQTLLAAEKAVQLTVSECNA
jgi:hypothetical protein